MTAKASTPDNAPSAIDKVFPVFTVRDLDEAIVYYRDKLGFTHAWSWGEPAVRAGVTRDQLELQLVCDPSLEAAGPSTIYCHMTGIEAFYRECQQRGATTHGELVDRAWGMKDFRLTDPSGNRLGFGEAITKERQANG